MRGPPETRKPATGKVTGFRNIELLPGEFDSHETSILDRQAQRLHDRFGLSWPTCRAVAELAFHDGRAGHA